MRKMIMMAIAGLLWKKFGGSKYGSSPFGNKYARRSGFGRNWRGF